MKIWQKLNFSFIFSYRLRLTRYPLLWVGRVAKYLVYKALCKKLALAVAIALLPSESLLWCCTTHALSVSKSMSGSCNSLMVLKEIVWRNQWKDSAKWVLHALVRPYYIRSDLNVTCRRCSLGHFCLLYLLTHPDHDLSALMLARGCLHQHIVKSRNLLKAFSAIKVIFLKLFGFSVCFLSPVAN